MKSKKLYKYLGLVLIIVPVLGLYQYLKNSVYIIIGIILILHSLDKKTNTKSENKPEVKKTAIRNSSGIVKEKEL